MIPAHEREHVERVAEALQGQPVAVQERWARALDHLEHARVYDAYLEFNELLKLRLGPSLQTHVQLQAVRCLRDAPVERSKTELALIDPQDAYQTVVLDYRLGWLDAPPADERRRGAPVLRPRPRGGPAAGEPRLGDRGAAARKRRR